jgi:hypothetical protein
LDGGWPEEVYYSKFQIGYNYEQLGWKKKQAIVYMNKDDKTEDENIFLSKWNPNNSDISLLLEESTRYFTEASANYLAAYNYRKTRAEALYYATRMYRLLNINEKAMNLAVMGNKIKYPQEDSLFIERACYDYLFDLEISIVAFYIPNNKDLGREALSRLIQRKDLPEWIVNLVQNNSRYYI